MKSNRTAIRSRRARWSRRLTLSGWETLERQLALCRFADVFRRGGVHEGGRAALQRQLEEERRARTLVRLEADAAAHALDDRLGDAQAEAGAALLPGIGAVG